MKKIKYLLPAVAMLFGMASCDNMDELYKDYKTDVSIYSTKISDLAIGAGWQRATLTWTAPQDNMAKGIHISWLEGEEEMSVTIDSLASEYTVTGLGSATYEFNVRSTDAYGNLSLSQTVSAKVYSDDDLRTVTTPKFTLSAGEASHSLKISDLSGAMNMWGGVLKIKLEGPATYEFDFSQEFNPLETKSYGYYSRIVENTWDLETILEPGDYKLTYEQTQHPTNFRQKTGGVFYYNKICVDPVPMQGEAAVTAAEIVVAEPEETPEETPAE